jgi:pyruvate carboxylase
MPQTRPIRSLLIANRGEIAIRVMRAASELGIRTVSVYSQEDRFSLHRMKADESYPVGDGKGAVEAYLDIEDIIRIARDTKADAVHPGYGFCRKTRVRRGMRRGRARLAAGRDHASPREQGDRA